MCLPRESATLLDHSGRLHPYYATSFPALLWIGQKFLQSEPPGSELTGTFKLPPQCLPRCRHVGSVLSKDLEASTRAC